MTGLSLTSVKLFDKLLDKATSPLLLETDWQSIVQVCDMIKTHEVGSKYIIQAIKKKLRHENPHIVLGTLQCIESIVKNCGESIHKEIAQKDIMDVLKELAKKSPDQIRNKVLEIIQCWSYGLGSQYKIFTDIYNQMKIENYHFPVLKESEAMFKTNDIAPEWRDNKGCFCCRQVFTKFLRKHHCRACGNSFCDKCSSKHCAIPKYHIDQNVRVCDVCYKNLTSKCISSVKPMSKNIRRSQVKQPVEIDEELQRVLAISQKEAVEKEREKKIFIEKDTTLTNVTKNSDIQTSESTNELTLEQITDNYISENEIDQFINLAIEHINNFKLRMLSDQQRNRNVSIDTAVQATFVILQNLHPELYRFMQLLDAKRTYYENFQDKLTQLKDAREALNALRAEHYERKQQETFERDRQRQIQLAQKLDFMRQKKQEYLEYQRQIHLQHLTQQELEMKNRLEQQRQFTIAREQNSHQSMNIYPIDTQMSSVCANQYYQINHNTDNNYITPAGQILLTNSTVPYIQYYQQQQQHVTENTSDPQLILLN